jgi:hypothetical protein
VGGGLLGHELNTIIEEVYCYEDLNVSTATTMTSGYRVVYREPATMKNAIVEEAECYEDLNVSTATMTTSGYRVVGDKTLTNKQRLLDCLQKCGVRPVSAKRHFITETTGAKKDSVAVMETEDVEMCDVSKASAHLLPTVQTGYEKSLLKCLGPTGTLRQQAAKFATLRTTQATLRTARAHLRTARGCRTRTGCRTWPGCRT